MSTPCEKDCVLITGGAGYIGSHTAIEVIKAGYDAVIIDNLCNSSKECLNRVSKILKQDLIFYEMDIRSRDELRNVFLKHKIKHVLHFAGLKAVGESSKIPLDYYSNNMDCTFSLVEVMKEFNVKSLVFSSSATVYGIPAYLPIDESHSVGACTNPYGRTKYFIEMLLEDLCISDKQWSVALLRYFNPAGAHPSGLIGEDPCGPPNNLMPYIAQVAVGRRKKLSIFGDDYDTPDGTGVRDYIHVVDLAEGHVSAIRRLERYSDEQSVIAASSPVDTNCSSNPSNSITSNNTNTTTTINTDTINTTISTSNVSDKCVCHSTPATNGLARGDPRTTSSANTSTSSTFPSTSPGPNSNGCFAFNLGTGSGFSVYEMISQFEKSSGKKIAYEVVGRRAGDVASCYANASLALDQLGWQAQKGLKQMCDDLWKWQSFNPNGFSGK